MVRWTVALTVLAFGLPHANLSSGNEVRIRWVSNALAEVMDGFAPFSQTNAECNHQSRLYLEALYNSTLWAVQMLDASSVSVGGLLTGDIYSLGHYDQCLDVREPMRAQYCLATLQYGPTPEALPSYYTPPNSTYVWPPGTASVWDKVKMTLDPGVIRKDVFHWALCVPASCTPQDVQESLNTTIKTVFEKHNLKGTVFVDSEHCEKVQNEITITEGYIITKFFILLIIVICVIATVYDYAVVNHREKKPESGTIETLVKVLMTFSLRRNVNELTEKGANPKLDVFNGAKVISIAAIIFGHRALFSHGLALYNHEFWELKQNHSYSDAALMNGTHLVDLFFVCSGFFTFLGIYKVLEKNKRLNFALAIILRWIRIVPPYLMVMGIVGWVLPHMSEGPLWNKRVGLEAERCQQNWWLNLLFINNYIHTDNQCLLLSWYLACDMQLFVVGMFATYVLWRWPKVGYALFAVLLVTSMAIPAYITYKNNYSGVLRVYASTLLNDPLSNEHYTTVYVKTHNRANPYIIGIIAAFIAHKMDAANYTLSKTTILIGTILFFGGGYAHQTYCYFFYQRDRPYSVVENALYAGLHRVTYPIGLAWCTISFYTSRFEPFQVLFGQPVFAPLARLLYCLVLIHPTVQLAYSSSARHSEHMNYPKMFWMACGDFTTSNLIALPLYLMVEAPSRLIIKMMFEGSKIFPSQKQSSSKEEETNTEPQTKQVVISKL